MQSFYILSLAALVVTVSANFDNYGCIFSQVLYNGVNSRIFYKPETGEICEQLDCGGGLAPLKTTVPGCPMYKGTATRTPKYLPGWGPDGFTEPTPTSKSSSTSGTQRQSSSQIKITTIQPSLPTTPSTKSQPESTTIISSFQTLTMIPQPLSTATNTEPSTHPIIGGTNTTLPVNQASSSTVAAGGATALAMPGMEALGLAAGVLAGLALF